MKNLKDFLILWLTQSFSSFGSSMTGFALIVWSYQQEGSALTTALLTVCTYAPYVLMSIFAGAISDRWNKKITMLVWDALAALCTVSVIILLKTEQLEIWHLYLINALNGLMNTVQQPASDVATTLLVPKDQYQRVSGMKSFSGSVINVLTPAAATALLTLAGLEAVLLFDLLTFATAFLALLFFVRIPDVSQETSERESFLQSATAGLRFLRRNRGVLDLILFLAAINFTASAFQAALPAMLLAARGGGETALGFVNTTAGLATIVGSLIASTMKPPKSRVSMVCNTLLISMSTENFLLAFGRSVPVWCLGSVLGWLCIPVMNANLDVLMRSSIPVEIQGRVFSARNTLQFFTIPVGYLLGGWLVDRVFEPLMAAQPDGGWLTVLFGSDKGSGAAMLFFFLGLLGVATCLIFRRDRHIRALEKK